jgi:aldehyde oxidoreductase
MQKKSLVINGQVKSIVVDPEASLGDVLRRQLLLTGTKVSCNDGHCGACSVILDGKLMLACLVKMSKVADGAKIETVEGIGTPEKLHPIQAAFAAYGAAQCGFCTPGMVVSTKALLDKNPNPTREEVRAWLTQHHNACRCTGYKQIVDGVMEAAKVMRGEMKIEELTFKMPADGKIWGSKYPRPSAVGKVTGTLDFGQLPKQRRCPVCSRLLPTRMLKERTALLA